MATFGILGEQVFAQLTGPAGAVNYPAAGVLSAIIFSMSLAVRPLARRIQESEALAHQRGVDLANLSELNEYIVQHLRESIVVVDGTTGFGSATRAPPACSARGTAATASRSGSVLADLADYVRAGGGSSTAART